MVIAQKGAAADAGREGACAKLMTTALGALPSCHKRHSSLGLGRREPRGPVLNEWHFVPTPKRFRISECNGDQVPTRTQGESKTTLLPVCAWVCVCVMLSQSNESTTLYVVVVVVCVVR